MLLYSVKLIWNLNCSLKACKVNVLRALFYKSMIRHVVVQRTIVERLVDVRCALLVRFARLTIVCLTSWKRPSCQSKIMKSEGCVILTLPNRLWTLDQRLSNARYTQILIISALYVQFYARERSCFNVRRTLTYTLICDRGIRENIWYRLAVNISLINLSLTFL